MKLFITKEQLINQGAECVFCPFAFSDIPEDKVLICMLSFGFDSIVLIETEKEFNGILQLNRHRGKQYFYLDKEVCGSKK